MRVTIDRNGCISCGSCEETCPEVFKLDDENLSSVVLKHRKGGPGKGEVSDDLASCVNIAKDACPVSVIATE